METVEDGLVWVSKAVDYRRRSGMGENGGEPWQRARYHTTFVS